MENIGYTAFEVENLVAMKEGKSHNRKENIKMRDCKVYLFLVAAAMSGSLFLAGCAAGNEKKAEIQEQIESVYEETITQLSEENVSMQDSEELESMEEASGTEDTSETEEANETEEYPQILFENILGYDGYYVESRPTPFPYVITYYGFDGNNYHEIATSWGEKRDDYVVDIDGDGVNELICNVMYGDGAERTVIYRREGNNILVGRADSLLDEEYDTSNYGNTYSYYRPEENVVEIFYRQENMEEFLSKKYEIDYEKISNWTVEYEVAE